MKRTHFDDESSMFHNEINASISASFTGLQEILFQFLMALLVMEQYYDPDPFIFKP